MPTQTWLTLKSLIARTECKPGWKFSVEEADDNLRLVITVEGRNSYHPEESLRVRHYFPAPIATYNEPSWRRWIFEQCRRLENHELGEWFRVDGQRPFAPLHGPGEDPYTVHEFRPMVDAETTQDGTVVPMSER